MFEVIEWADVGASARGGTPVLTIVSHNRVPAERHEQDAA
jgi:hypothetical protein